MPKQSLFALMAPPLISLGICQGCGVDSSDGIVIETSNPTPTTSSSGRPSSSGTSPNRENPTASPSDKNKWSVHIVSKCSPEDLEKCPGLHGLLLSGDGTYAVGPGPQGEKLNGNMDAADLQKLNEELRLRTSPSRVSLECARGQYDGVDEMMEIHFPDSSLGHIRKTKKELCYSSMSRKEAKHLRELLSNLTSKYYPASFPNPVPSPSPSVNPGSNHGLLNS